jgi:hypothetical protein
MSNKRYNCAFNLCSTDKRAIFSLSISMKREGFARNQDSRNDSFLILCYDYFTLDFQTKSCGLLSFSTFRRENNPVRIFAPSNIRCSWRVLVDIDGKKL